MSQLLDAIPVARTALTIHTGDQQSEIVVLDSRGRLLERGFGPTRKFELEPGIYRVKVLTGEEFQEKSIVVTGAPLELRFAPVAFASPVPLAGTSTSHEYHMGAADTESRQIHLADGAGSSLFFLVRDWNPTSRPPSLERRSGHPAEGLSLHEVSANGQRKICDLAVAGRHNRNGDPWAACTIAVRPGVYELRLELPGEVPLRQSVVASKGWQTQSFLFLRKYTGDARAVWRADLSRTSVLLAGVNGGFSPNENSLRIAELARVALATTRPRSPSVEPRPLMPAEMRTLLRDKFGNPMMGIYGAHLLLMETPVDLPIFTEVVRNLRGLIPDHPDVEALALCAAGELPPKPFAHPPMLRRSWALIVDASVTQPAVVTQSLGAREMLAAAEGPWHIWRVEPEVIEKRIATGGALDLSEIEVALAEELGVMKGVRRSRQRSRNRSRSVLRDSIVPKGTLASEGVDDAPGAPDADIQPEDREVPIDVDRMRSIATRFGMPSMQLKRTLAALEHKLTNSSEAPNIRLLWK